MGTADRTIDLERPFDAVDPGDWREEVSRLLGGAPPSALDRRLLDGITVHPLYVERPHALDRPGAPPFTRGSEPELAAPRLVDRAFADSLEALRTHAARAARQEVDELLVDGNALGSLARAADLPEALAAITLPVRVHADGFAEALLESDRVAVAYDPLGWLARGRLTTSIDDAIRRLGALVERARHRHPDARPIVIDGRLAHAAGAGAADELAIAMAMGIAYLRLLASAGQPLADLPRRIELLLSVDAEQWVGIAKLRAARWMWSKVLRAIGIDGPEQGLRIHAFTSERELGTLDPHINLLRGTVAAFAALTGGAQRITVAPFEPTAHGAHLARNTLHLLRAEAALTAVRDPGGGSYALEAMTEALARKAWTTLQEIEHLGGAERGLLDGSLAERLDAAGVARAEALATRARVRVGEDRTELEPRPLPETVAVPVAEHASDALTTALREDGWLEALDDARETPLAELRRALSSDEAPTDTPRWVSMRDAAAFEALHGRRAQLGQDRRSLPAVFAGERLDPKAAGLLRGTLSLAGLSATPAPLETTEIDVTSKVVVVLAPDDDALVAAAEALEAGDRLLVAVAARSDALEAAGYAGFLEASSDRVALLERILSALEAP